MKVPKQTANVFQRITKPALSTTKSSAIFIRDPCIWAHCPCWFSDDLKAGDKIGLFSYGSGAVGEFFAAALQEGFKEVLAAAEHGKMFAGRTEVSVKEYEEIFSSLPIDGSSIELDVDADLQYLY